MEIIVLKNLIQIICIIFLEIKIKNKNEYEYR